MIKVSDYVEDRYCQFHEIQFDENHNRILAPVREVEYSSRPNLSTVFVICDRCAAELGFRLIYGNPPVK